MAGDDSDYSKEEGDVARARGRMWPGSAGRQRIEER